MLANGPIMWSSKRQTITARSSTEAEIYATDECVKCLQIIRHLRQDRKLPDADSTIPIYNDNQACVMWSHNNTSKGLRHIQIRENAIRESIQNKHVSISHVEGKINPADIFTKEDRDTNHFLQLRNLLLFEVPLYGSIQAVIPKQSICP